MEPQDALASARAVRIADLPPYERNSRTHSPSQVEDILRSVVEFGWTIPVLYDDQGVVAGHGRLMAAELAAERDIRLFMLPGEAQGGAPIPEGCVPAIDCSGWSDAQRRAYIIADNKIALNAGWDYDLLRVEIDALKGMDFDLTKMGFTEGEIGGFYLDKVHGENDPAAEWQGMPEFQQDDKTPFRTLQVHFFDAAGLERFAKLLGQPISGRTKFLWFPAPEIETYADKRWVGKGEQPADPPAEGEDQAEPAKPARRPRKAKGQ